MAGPPVSLAASSPVDDERFPRFREIRDQAWVCELEAGDALYLPKLWWGTRSSRLQPSMAHQLLVGCLRRRPGFALHQPAAGHDHDRRAPGGGATGLDGLLRSLCLRSQGHPLAHLPPEERGVLGALEADNYANIRARVMQLLRGRLAGGAAQLLAMKS